MPPIPFRRATPCRSPGTPARLRRLTVVAVLTALSATGCGVPPELRGSAATPTGSARTASPNPSGSPSAAPSASPTGGLPGTGFTSPTASPGLVAVACANGPSGARVTDLVRGRGGVLPRGARVQVRTGPLCAADWQYTVLDVTGHEQLQVVTQGAPSAPRLVTAGTDVCTAEVRVTAPTGIRTLACDGGPVTGPGA